MVVLLSLGAAGFLLSLVCLVHWLRSEFRNLRRQVEQLKEQGKESQDFKSEARAAFSKAGLKWVPPQRAQPGKWEDE